MRSTQPRALADVVCSGAAGLPDRITTNYDRFFERALREDGKQPRVSVYRPTDEPTTSSTTSPPSALSSTSCTVTSRTAIARRHRRGLHPVRLADDRRPYDPVPLSLKYFLKRWTTLFIGYSLLDYNLRLLFKTLRWRVDPARVPDTFSIDSSPDELILDVWESQRRFVTFVAQDVWSFVPALYEAVRGEELSP